MTTKEKKIVIKTNLNIYIFNILRQEMWIFQIYQDVMDGQK
jgi:hypothetical protein